MRLWQGAADVFAWRRRRRVERDVQKELDLHVQLETRQNLERGMSPEQAAREARAALGNIALIQEDVRAVWRWRWLDALAQSLAHALRSLRRTPGFSLVAIAVLALGIGLNTAIFSLAYGVLVRPFPYPGAESIVVVHMRDPRTGRPTSGFSWLDLGDWTRRSRSFEALALSQRALAALDGDAGYERFDGWTVSGSFFAIFGNPLLMGRGVTDARLPEAVISHRLWRERFAGDPTTVGRPILVNGRQYTVVGVARPDFRVPTDAESVTLGGAGSAVGAPDIWWPFPPSNDRRMRATHLIGRMKPGVTLPQAQSDAESVARALAEEHTPGRQADPVVVRLRDHVSGAWRRPLSLLLVAVGLVLLVACANVTSLLLARQIAVNGRLLAFAAGVVVVTALAFGSAPAVHALRQSSRGVLREQRTVGSGARLRRGLVAAEVALALVLLVGAGLLVQSFARLVNVDLGFTPAKHGGAAGVPLPRRQERGPRCWARGYRELLSPNPA